MGRRSRAGRARLAWVTLLLVALAPAAALPALAQDTAAPPARPAALPPPPVIGNTGLPFRLSVSWGTAALSGDLSDYMDGGLDLGASLEVPVSRALAVEVPVSVVHRRDLKHPLRFPYTDPYIYTPGHLQAKGYCNTIGVGLRWQPRLDLSTETRRGLWRLEPSVSAGWLRAFVGWEPRVEGADGASAEYGDNHRFGAQSGWGPYAGAGLSLVHYSDGDFTVAGLGLEFHAAHVSTDGDELLPVGTSVSGSTSSFALRLTFGGR
jgi:hypothetical protein